jgi:hypothetical protein
MQKLIKGFSQFVNESAQVGDTIQIDLIEEFPERFSREERLSGYGDDNDDYTHDIETTLTAELLEVIDFDLHRLGLSNIPDLPDDFDEFMTADDSYSDPDLRFKAKLTFSDQENGYGNYGPGGGGYEKIVFVGLASWSEEAILDRFDFLSRETDAFDY